MNKRGPKPADQIITDELCSYGCGQTAQYQNRTGKKMCCSSSTKCPANKQKNSQQVAKCHAEGRHVGFSKSNRSWAKGLTKENDPRIKKHADTKRGKRKTTDEEVLRKIIYREQCQFNLSGIIDKIEGYSLLVEHGMYSNGYRPNFAGVVRDHVVSVIYGYDNNIDPKIISHPANCRFILHLDNARKGRRCAVSLDELQKRIENWERDGNR